MTDTSGLGSEFERFRVTFFEECNEILSDLETHLARVQTEILDGESLNAVFRAAHSIKAGAGAFGYTQLVHFTHDFEALLDRMRSGELSQTDRIAQILIRGGDVLAELVAAAEAGGASPADLGSDILDEIHVLLGKDSAVTDTDGGLFEDAGDAGDAGGQIVYSIALKPNPDLFRNATEPLLLIRELRQLGELEVVCDWSALPPLERMDPENAYLAWDFRLTTDKPKSAIEEVFEFVDDTCGIVIEEAGPSSTAVDAGSPDAAPAPTMADEAAPDPAPGAIASPHSPPSSAAQSGTASPPPAAKGGGQGSIRVDLARVDRLVNVVGELVITQAMLAQQIVDLGLGNGRQQIRGNDELASLTRELQECVMAIRMQPVKSIFARMPRLVRDLSSKLGKKVRLSTSGELTEVDKTVIEELADPLTHMIRNSIDHGIEMPADRLAAGKVEEGTIQLSAAHVGGNILIQIADDGAGINRPRLLQKAVEKGIVPAGAQLSDEEIDDLIFSPGFSTAAAVTDISGRGVGMDVVRRNIVNLGGRIQVQTQPGLGTRFTLAIPLTLAVLDGMIVAVGKERYVLPLTSIVESFRPDRNAVRRLAGGVEVVSIRGEFVRLVHLNRVFDVKGAVEEPWNGLVVLVETAGGQTVGVTVDELIGQQQVVIKSLADNFDPVPGISGATILGNGRVALILDIERLATMAHRPAPARSPNEPVPQHLDAAE
ncbi:Chemotaxis protein CheA [Hartmannibacter diazotrophicus]|uniref:Chemotaxis protein CheA n=1 Tax=Hartmannibacter diazotrophicus TaxID=1482074 RepID=A0A2C9DDC9_9HYPH|nr:chemotaxis protein CheA [Hartmannibacter diazotrophicus]SON58256.1 Chemotaxis protein CheA [Hartmannibacter diazotrophicus]